jgi:hypothetical protein
VVEQTIGDLKRAKVMNDNKISTAATMEKVLDCVIALHNLRVLCKVNPDFELPARRAALPDEHIIKRIIPKNEVDLKIPADKPNLSLPDLRHIRDFVEFLPSAVGAISKATERVETSVFFIQMFETADLICTKGLMCCSCVCNTRDWTFGQSNTTLVPRTASKCTLDTLKYLATMLEWETFAIATVGKWFDYD